MPCPTVGCPELVDRTIGDCPRGHATQRRKAAQRRTDALRPSAAARGYGPAWRKHRTAYLRANPRCCDCGAPATVPDHDPITRAELVRRGDPNPDAWRHLRPRCRPCHSSKTNRRDGGYGNPTSLSGPSGGPPAPGAT